MGNIWNIIVHTNTFNFIIFAILIVIILKSIDAPKLISGLCESIAKPVTDSEKAKDDAKKNLADAEDKTKNIDNEIKSIIEKSEKTAQNISDEIVEQANAQIKIIENNTQKILANNEKITRKNLSQITTRASLRLAEKDLQENLYENPNLHKIFIEEAIEELENVEL